MMDDDVRLEAFQYFVTTSPTAAPPYMATDYLALVRAGKTYKIPANGFGATGANPTATIGTTAVNGTATTFMRSDAAPPAPLASSSVFGLVKVDGSTILAASGVITAVEPVGADPTATASATAVNGKAATFLRSDGAPAVAVMTATVGGLVPTPPNNTTTFLRGDATFASPPAVPVGADPTATIGFSAVNGTATTFMRSDGAPKLPSDIALLDATDQTLSGGAVVTSHNLGTITSGTVTVDCGQCPLQYLTNGGAFTLAAPGADGSTIILVTNNGSAGAIAFTGFTAESGHGDALNTTDTDKFSIFVWRINGTADYNVKAHQ